MAIGEQPTVASMNQELTSYVQQIRALMTQIQGFTEDVNDMGAAGLQAVGFASADATAYMTDAGYLTTIQGVYFGTATQATDFNFDNAFASARDVS